MHLNAVVWGQTDPPGENKPADTAKLVRDLGFDSVTSYVWIHHVSLPEQVRPTTTSSATSYFPYWDKAQKLVRRAVFSRM